jgi:hypothetical protein
MTRQGNYPAGKHKQQLAFCNNLLSHKVECARPRVPGRSQPLAFLPPEIVLCLPVRISLLHLRWARFMGSLPPLRALAEGTNLTARFS